MRLAYTVFIFILLLAACKSGQVVVNNGTEAFEQKRFVQASQMLEKEANDEKDIFKKIEKLQMLAQAYDQMSKSDKQVEALQQIADLDANPQYLFDLALAQKQNEQYEEALANLNKYKGLTNDFYYSSGHIDFCEEVIAYDEKKI